MLTISGIGSAGGAADYYGADDYYTTGEADSPGLEWGGKAAKSLGFTGVAEPDQFRQVLEGSHCALQSDATPHPDRRSGWDLTFSAPKSVSLAILVGGDQRLDRAHDRAVDRAMTYVEKHFAVTRQRRNGSIEQVPTGNLLYAKTVHGTSRHGDPQRHTHVVLANATVEPGSRKVRALETLHLYKHRQLVGRVYQAELAKEALALGYDVRRDVNRGTFELAQVSRRDIEAFSRRHEQIQATMKAEETRRGRPLNGAEREAAALRNRPRKLDTSRDELTLRWQEQAKAIGLDQKLVQGEKGRAGSDVTSLVSGGVSETKSRFLSVWLRMIRRAPGGADPYASLVGERNRDFDARQAVSFGIQVAEEGAAVFSRHEIVRRAMDVAKAGMTADRLEREVGLLLKDGRLKAAGEPVRGEMTTARALTLERGVVDRVQEGRYAARPLVSDGRANALLDDRRLAANGFVLRDEQREAARHILTSPDRYVGVQGSAGVGKTAMCRTVNDVVVGEGGQIVGLAPTHQAVKALQDGTGIASSTLESFLYRHERAPLSGIARASSEPRDWSKAALLVDEASMLSNSQCERLMRVSEALGVQRVVFMGDERQLGSPEAGAPWRLMLANGLSAARMTEIQRQRDPQIRDAVMSLAQGAHRQAFSALGASVVEVGIRSSEAQLAQAAFVAWREERGNDREAAVIVPTNALRERISSLIRTELVSDGTLKGDPTAAQVLSKVRMTRAEAFRAESYREGQILVLHQGVKASSLKRDEQVSVVGRDDRNNLLMVARADGARTSLDLQAMQHQRKLKFDAYDPRSLDVRSGEALTWERSAADRGIRTGDRFTVERIDGDRWTIRTSTGGMQELRSSDPALRFVSYAYAETADRSQGSTYESVVAVLASTQGEAANQARAYVQVSRTAGKLTFVTDNLNQLARALDRQTGVNTIASHELASLVRASEIPSVVELGKTEATAPRVDRDDEKEKGFDKERGFSREEYSL
ncbi:MobF family relaxase [Brevundimonas bullata]|uniref:MobF family relaxase n=1 Tax=Brevundimonas bullata TaxID=13160 RepID=UPI003D9A86DE